MGLLSLAKVAWHVAHVKVIRYVGDDPLILLEILKLVRHVFFYRIRLQDLNAGK